MEKKKISLVCFLLLLKRDKNVWHLKSISSVWRHLAFLPVILSKLKVELPYDPAISFLGIYSEKCGSKGKMSSNIH